MTQQPSRRNFLRSAAVGAAVVGVAAATPQALAGTASSAAARPIGGQAANGPVTAYVRDHRTGEIAVMVGEHEVIHHDRELATRLARIGASAK